MAHTRAGRPLLQLAKIPTKLEHLWVFTQGCKRRRRPKYFKRMCGTEILAPFMKTIQATALPHVHGQQQIRTNTKEGKAENPNKKFGRAAPPYCTVEEFP